jgi:hypothetical protein
MIRASWRMLCFCLFTGLLTQSSMTAIAQSGSNSRPRIANGEPAKAPKLPDIRAGDFRPPVLLTFRYDLLPMPLTLTTDLGPTDPATLLQNAIAKRIGVRYRYRGIDDRGYDCSGFVWSVFKETGADFERGPAHTLWRQLPEATDSETRQFGTLVFFNRLRHVGIVRDGESFYHASRSKGVKISSFSGYWKRRITGFRRAPAPILPEHLISASHE